LGVEPFAPIVPIEPAFCYDAFNRVVACVPTILGGEKPKPKRKLNKGGKAKKVKSIGTQPEEPEAFENDLSAETQTVAGERSGNHFERHEGRNDRWRHHDNDWWRHEGGFPGFYPGFETFGEPELCWDGFQYVTCPYVVG